MNSKLLIGEQFGKETLKLGNVLLLECMSFNIFSLQKARQSDFYYGFKEVQGKTVLKRDVADNKVHQLALITKTAGRWTLDCKVLPPPAPSSGTHAEALVSNLSMDLFHQRMGHTGKKALDRIIKEDLATGVDKVVGVVSSCDACQLGKLTRPPHPPVAFCHATTLPLQLAVVDLAVLVKPYSLGGASYILGILDVNTRFSWVVLLKKKSDAHPKLMEWKGIAERECGQKLRVLRSDGGGEFNSNEFKSLMAMQGVRVQATAPDSP